MSVIHLHLDFETSSPLNIKDVGLDRYARTATPLMLAYAVNDQPPQLWLPHESPLPDVLRPLLRAKGVIKIAWNAPFERSIFMHGKGLGLDIPLDQWLDPSLMARYASIADSLELASKVLGLDEDVAKMADEGKRLIKKFSCEYLRGHKKPHEDPEDFAKFGEYCKRDVIAERAIYRMLQRSFSLSPFEQRLWQLDQKINERGMPVDLTYVNQAKKMAEQEKFELLKKMHEITGVSNPNSNKQLLSWLKEQNYPYASLGKDWINKAISEAQ